MSEHEVFMMQAVEPAELEQIEGGIVVTGAIVVTKDLDCASSVVWGSNPPGYPS